MTQKELIITEIERRLADNKKEIERAVHKHLEEYFEGFEDALSMLRDFINSLPEEPELTGLKKEVADSYISRVDRKRIPITIKGELKRKFKDEFNTMWQTVEKIPFSDVAGAIVERLCRHFAAWGAYYLKDAYTISDVEKDKLDINNEPVSKDLEEAAIEYCQATTTINNQNLKDEVVKAKISDFKAGAQWQRNHVWHDASERPKKNRTKTAWITKKGTTYTGWFDKDAVGYERMQNAMLNFDFDEIDKWAYLNDILPTKSE